MQVQEAATKNEAIPDVFDALPIKWLLSCSLQKLGSIPKTEIFGVTVIPFSPHNGQQIGIRQTYDVK